MKKTLAALLISATVAGSALAKPVTVKGSDTMVIMNAKLAEAFMNKSPGAQIQVTGGGSGVGIAALINGTTDIAASSRPIKTSEIDKLKARFATRGVGVPIARDGLAVYLNTANPVQELSLPQLMDIYTGRVTNWKQVGGKDLAITVYSDAVTGGTRAMVKKVVLGGEEYAAGVKALTNVARVAEVIAKDESGFGAVGRGFVDEGKTKIVDTKKIERPLGFVTIGEPSPKVKQVIEAFKASSK